MHKLNSRMYVIYKRIKLIGKLTICLKTERLERIGKNMKEKKTHLNITGTQCVGVKLILGVMQINQGIKYLGSRMLRDCL